MSHRGRKKRVQPKFNRINDRQMRQIHQQVVQTPLASSTQIFGACDMPKMSRATRCKALREVAVIRKSMRNPPLKQRHKDKRMEWVKKYMKTDFSSVIFTDECRARLDGPDQWRNYYGPRLGDPQASPSLRGPLARTSNKKYLHRSLLMRKWNLSTAQQNYVT